MGTGCRRFGARNLVLLVPAVLALAIACGDGPTETVPDRSGEDLPPVALATASVGDLSITTDKDDYAPGDTVWFTGAGWSGGDLLDIVLTDEPTNHRHEWTIEVREDGTFRDSTYVVDSEDLGVTFTLTATSRGSPEQTLTVVFTDGNIRFITSPASLVPSVTYDRFNGSTTCGGTAAQVGRTLTYDDGVGNDAVGLDADKSIRVTIPAVSGYSYTGYANGGLTITPASAPSNTTLCVTGFAGGSQRRFTLNYSPVAPSKTDQTITFTSTAPTGAVFGGTYAVSATASSNLTVSFSSQTSSVCTVSGSTVSFVGVGTCTIAADQAGNGSFNPAPQVTQSFEVGKAAATITLSDLAHVYNGTPKSATATTNPAGLAVVTITYDGTGTAPTDAGSYAVVASLDNAHYQATDATGTLVIEKAPQTITFTSGAPSNAVIGGTYAVTATASSGLAVVFSSLTPAVCTVSAGMVSFVGVGSCTVAADQAGNTNYFAAPQQTQAFTVKYVFSGFSAPVDWPTTVNLAKAGQAIPLKWRLTDANGIGVTTLTSVKVTASSYSCARATTTDNVEEYASGTSGLQNLGDGYYQFNWKTPTNYANSCKTIGLDFGGYVESPTAIFEFKK